MKYMRLVSVFALVTALFVAPFTAAADSTPAGNSPSDEQVQSITLNCRKAQRTLARVEISDGVTRANRGKKYEDILKLQSLFNTRVSTNKVDAPLLISSTSTLQSQLNTFRSYYIRYDELISEVVKADCGQNPRDFYTKLTEARNVRANLAESIATMDATIGQFSNGLQSLRSQLTTKTNGGGQ